MKLLDVQNLHVAFACADKSSNAANTAQDQCVVRDVSFTVDRGQCVALVGESGAGKTLTSRSIVRLLPRGAYIQSGQILFDGADIAALPEKAVVALRGKKIGMIFQDPLAALNPLHRVGDQVAECLRVHKGLTETQLRSRVLDLFDLVQLDRPAERYRAYPHELSGGQRQRIMLALAAANDPDLLIADEPTTALDATVQQAILLLLADLRKELGVSLLLISHDLAMVRRFADTVHVMRHGRILESSSSLFTNPQHEYTHSLLRAGSEDWARPVPSNQVEPVLTVKDLHVGFPRSKTRLFQRKPEPFTALDGVDFTLWPGECLGIVGESGSGKSTLALAVLRLIASRGHINFKGRDIQHLSHAEMAPLRSKIQVVLQNPFLSLNPRMCVRELVEEGLRVHALPAEQRDGRVHEALTDLGLSPAYAQRFPHELSGGERQRVAIARALALRPEVLLLDEPTSSLDRALQFQIIDLLRDLQARYGMAFIYISHDLALVKGFCQRVLVLDKGKCVEQGAVREIFAAPQSRQLRALLEAAMPEEFDRPCANAKPHDHGADVLSIRYRRKAQFARQFSTKRPKGQKRNILFSVGMHACLLGAIWSFPMQASGGGESSMQVSLVGMDMGTATKGRCRMSSTNGTNPDAVASKENEASRQEQIKPVKKEENQVKEKVEKPDLVLKEKNKPQKQKEEQTQKDKPQKPRPTDAQPSQAAPRSLGSESQQDSDADSAGTAAQVQGSGRNDGGQGGGSGGGQGTERGRGQGKGAVYGMNDWDVPPVVTHRVKPNYPDAAKQARKEAIVTVRAVIDPSGRILRAIVLSRDDSHLFAEETLAAVKRWHFSPGKAGGRPVMCVVEIPVVFKLDR